MTGQLRFILPVVWLVGTITAWKAVQAFLLGTPHALEAGPGWFIMLLVFAVLSELRPVPYTLGRVIKDESLTITVILLALFTFGWPTAVLLAALTVIIADLSSSKPYYKVLFNASMYVIATGAAGAVYAVTAAQLQIFQPALPQIGQLIAAQLAGGLAYYAVNLTLLMLVLSRISRVRLPQMMVWGLRDSALVNFTLVTIAVVMARLWEIHPTAAAILLPPLLMAKVGYERYTQLHTEAESMLAALADMIDMRDDATGKHSLRVSEMSYGAAQALNVSEEQALLIKAIARVHDVGKIVVRDAVLLKPGKLTLRERAEVEAHTEAGGRILNHLSAFRSHLAILLEHHERPDGRGYPFGRKSDEINLGARIIAACDAYDTITSDRPYRQRQPGEIAMAELHRHSGTQFDPKVVRALETWLIQEHTLRADWRAVLEKTQPDEKSEIVLRLETPKFGAEGNGGHAEAIRPRRDSDP